MSTVISLREFVDEMQMVNSEIHAYINQVTGEFFTVTNEVISAAEGEEEGSGLHDWEPEELDQAIEILNSEDYLKLPSQFELNEYDIMERFCGSIQDERLSDTLFDNIRGSGAFRRFKNTIIRYHIDQDWYRFRDDAFKEIAIQWLVDNGLAYTDDLTK